jgi:hypothetical protein
VKVGVCGSHSGNSHVVFMMGATVSPLSSTSLIERKIETVIYWYHYELIRQSAPGGEKIENSQIDNEINIKLTDCDYWINGSPKDDTKSDSLGEVELEILDMALLEVQVLAQQMLNCTDAVGDIGQYTSIESGHLKLHKARFDLHEKYGSMDWRKVAADKGYGYVLALVDDISQLDDFSELP